MPLVDINVPSGAQVSNYLFVGESPEDLGQDLITVRLPTGFFVDLGWYPESDPSGHYVVRVFRGYWDRQVIDPVQTTDQGKAIKSVEYLAERFSRPVINSGTTNSNQTIITVPKCYA